VAASELDMSRMTSLATAAAVAGVGIYFLRRWYARRTLYCLNVTLYVKPERRAEFLQCIKNNKAGTLSNEPLAVTYCYGEDTKEPNTFHFHEQYIGREGFEAHTKALHFAAWEKFASSDPFSAPPVVKFWTAPLALAAAATGDETRSSHPRAAAVSCLNARLVVKPERRADFLKAIGDDAAATLRDEPLAISFLVGEDESTPNLFHLHEQYWMQAGIEAHRKTPHFAEWTKFLETEPLEEELWVRFYDNVP